MKPKIIAENLEHLSDLIKQEISKNGNECDLNHINVSNITDTYRLFCYSDFYGEISQWDVSNVKEMTEMFARPKFNKDISAWDVSNFKSMNDLFYESNFTQDLISWKPFKLENIVQIFIRCQAPIPYWAKIEDEHTTKRLIESHLLAKELNKILDNKEENKKKTKIIAKDIKSPLLGKRKDQNYLIKNSLLAYGNALFEL